MTAIIPALAKPLKSPRAAATTINEREKRMPRDRRSKYPSMRIRDTILGALRKESRWPAMRRHRGACSYAGLQQAAGLRRAASKGLCRAWQETPGGAYRNKTPGGFLWKKTPVRVYCKKTAAGFCCK